MINEDAMTLHMKLADLDLTIKKGYKPNNSSLLNNKPNWISDCKHTLYKNGQKISSTIIDISLFYSLF